ncbi:MAG TPA: TadE/TadG family type IV pilus assembly protein [Anaerolineae bacterium]
MKVMIVGRRRALQFLARFIHSRSGIAATEFAFILPIMLVLFFGVVEATNGIAAYRDVSMMVHTTSDLTSQSKSVQDADLTNYFNASTGLFYPYVTSATDPNLKQSISQLWVDSNLHARVQWAKNSDGTDPPSPGTIVTIPDSLKVAGTYVIYSSASYLYVPTVGYVMNKAGITLRDFAYTRPRMSQCVFYNTPEPLPTACPQS